MTRRKVQDDVETGGISLTRDEPGGFYRDVPAGHYHIAPVSYNRDINQDRDVDLAAGQQLYVKILSSQSWDGACRDCVRDTFYAWVIPPQIAEGEIARVRNSI